jgi:hypothetical protein
MVSQSASAFRIFNNANIPLRPRRPQEPVGSAGGFSRSAVNSRID